MIKVLKSNRTYELLFIIIVLFSFLLWVGGIFLEGQNGNQYNLFFRRTEDFLADFLNPIGYSSQRDPYNNTMYTGTYAKQQPPLQYLLSYPFVRIITMGSYWAANDFRPMYYVSTFSIVLLLLLLLLYSFGFFLIMSAKKGVNIVRGGTAFAILFSAPMIFTIERCNSVILVPFLCLAFLFFRNSKNALLRELSILSLAIATGLKLIPAILGIILLYEKKWKMAIRAIIYGVMAVFLPFLFFKGGLGNISLMLRNMKDYMELFTYNEIGVSIRDLLMWISSVFGYKIPHVFGIVLVAFTTIGFLAGSFFAKKEWMRYLFLCLPLLSVPGHQGLYCIIYLIPVVITFLNELHHDISDVIFILGIIIAFSPYQFAFLRQFSTFEIGMIFIYIFAIYQFLRILTKVIRNGSKFAFISISE